MTDPIPAEDLEVEALQHGGGQVVGVRSSIRLTHKPSGISITVETERSRHRNKAIAMDALMGALTSPHFRG